MDEKIFKIKKIDGWNTIEYIPVPSPDADNVQIEFIQKILKEFEDDISIVSYTCIHGTQLKFDIQYTSESRAEQWNVVCSNDYKILDAKIEEIELSEESSTSLTEESLLQLQTILQSKSENNNINDNDVNEDVNDSNLKLEDDNSDISDDGDHKKIDVRWDDDKSWESGSDSDDDIDLKNESKVVIEKSGYNADNELDREEITTLDNNINKKNILHIKSLDPDRIIKSLINNNILNQSSQLGDTNQITNEEIKQKDINEGLLNVKQYSKDNSNTNETDINNEEIAHNESVKIVIERAANHQMLLDECLNDNDINYTRNKYEVLDSNDNIISLNSSVSRNISGDIKNIGVAMDLIDDLIDNGNELNVGNDDGIMDNDNDISIVDQSNNNQQSRINKRKTRTYDDDNDMYKLKSTKRRRFK